MVAQMDLTSYVEHTHTATDDAVLWETFKSFLLPYGFDSLIFCLMSDHPSIAQKATHGIITGYPDDWMKHYKASNYEPIDLLSGKDNSKVGAEEFLTDEQVRLLIAFRDGEEVALTSHNLQEA